MIKQILKRIIFSFANPHYLRQFRKCLKAAKGQELWIVDIDNTIADSAPGFRQQWASTAERLEQIPVLEGMRKRVLEAGKEKKIIFLTARNYKYAAITRQWLEKNGFPVSAENLVIVPEAADKLPYFREAAQSARLTVFDDMTYNHEGESIKSYDKIIGQLKAMPLTYIGYEELREINQL